MTHAAPDHYRVLGVPVNADTAAIREAYRKLSRVYHPDRHRGAARATACFQLISSAWTELSDPGKRLHYDRMLILRDPLRMVDDPRAERALDVLDLVVKRLRRDKPVLPAEPKPIDLRVAKKISFARAVLGGVERVDAHYTCACPACRGQGTDAPERNPVCHVCQGTGGFKVGVPRQRATCGFCGGRGAVLVAECVRCKGSGEVSVERSIEVQVPPGCRNGSVLRVRGVGEVATGTSEAGDLLVDVQVEPHPLLKIDGNDLVCTVAVPWSRAALGGPIEVPTLEGVERLTLPAGCQSGQELRIAGRGLPNPSGRGHLRVQVQVEVPRELAPAQAEAIAALDRFLAPAQYPSSDRYLRALAALRDASGAS
ncbi:MAG: DnaJ domain-containing protein [Deltaproteobacteria bacterium]|nr:DnaJ domain-containing protein [Deltaproteobacteria bacterium]